MSGCASPAPPGYPGAQNTRVASVAVNSVLMCLGYHSPALRVSVGRSALSSMRVPAAPKAVEIFLHVLRARGWIADAFVVLAAAGIYGALQVPNDPSTERLIVASDPVALATRDFDRIFLEGVQALIMLETPNPLGLAALRAA